MQVSDDVTILDATGKYVMPGDVPKVQFITTKLIIFWDTYLVSIKAELKYSVCLM